MPADPVEAGRKGGRSRSAKKLAAIRRNGFQPRPKPTDAQAQTASPVDEQPRPAVLVADEKDAQ